LSLGELEGVYCNLDGCLDPHFGPQLLGEEGLPVHDGLVMSPVLTGQWLISITTVGMVQVWELFQLRFTMAIRLFWTQRLSTVVFAVVVLVLILMYP